MFLKMYSDYFDVPPPQSDSEAKKLASKIKKWISDGRPKPDDMNNEEPKKQKGMFGRFGK